MEIMSLSERVLSRANGPGGCCARPERELYMLSDIQIAQAAKLRPIQEIELYWG